MREDHDKELERALRSADPADRQELADWAQSEAGKRAHDRILELREKRPERAPSGRRVLRPALLAAAALVVVAAIVVGVVLGTRGPAGEVVESTSTTAAESTSTTAVATPDGVERIVALATVVRSLEAIRTSTSPHLPESQPTDPEAYVERAEALGITLPAERDVLLASGSVTRGMYALWVWRAFGDVLPHVREADFVDVGALPEDVREAVLGVAGAGILDGRAEGRFEADQPLTVEEEEQATNRLWIALGLVKEPGSDH